MDEFPPSFGLFNIAYQTIPNKKPRRIKYIVETLGKINVKEIAKVFNGVQIDSSAVSGNVESGDDTTEDDIAEDGTNNDVDSSVSGEFEIKDDTIVNSETNSIQDGTTTDNNTENNTEETTGDIHTENQDAVDGEAN